MLQFQKLKHIISETNKSQQSSGGESSFCRSFGPQMVRDSPVPDQLRPLVSVIITRPSQFFPSGWPANIKGIRLRSDLFMSLKAISRGRRILFPFELSSNTTPTPPPPQGNPRARVERLTSRGPTPDNATPWSIVVFDVLYCALKR